MWHAQIVPLIECRRSAHKAMTLADVMLFILSIDQIAYALFAMTYHIAPQRIMLYIASYHIGYCIISYCILHRIKSSYHIIPFHFKSNHIISFHIILYHIVSYHDFSRIINNLDAAALCFYSLLWLPCLRMAWPEAPGVTGPTTQHLLCAHSRMNSVCRRPWVSGTPQALPPTEAWRTSSDVARQNLSMVAFRCWPPWDTSPQWLGFAEAAFKIVSAMYVFINVWKGFHFCIHDIVAESTGFAFECVPMKQSPGDHWQVPWLLISICRFEVRRCA